MTELSVLRHDEGIRVDGRRVVELYDELGATAAELVIGRAAEELAAALEGLVAAARSEAEAEGHAARLGLRAQSLGALAWQVGLASLAQVAADVAVCAERGDHPALAATLARLERVGNRSLTAVWDAQDIRR
ncbi:hypothetical protein ACEYYA_07995 [Paracoccus sp. p3-h83]|uniref:hypothetical protein n=1 Tax=Paracoccus sp. p3-h83 TaxID=3342805 RepID=UPI0035B96A2E